MAVVWVGFQKKHVIFRASVYLSDIGRRVAILAGGAGRHAYCRVPIPHPEPMAMESLMIDICKVRRFVRCHPRAKLLVRRRWNF